jgi:hypothetical protein
MCDFIHLLYHSEQKIENTCFFISMQTKFNLNGYKILDRIRYKFMTTCLEMRLKAKGPVSIHAYKEIIPCKHPIRLHVEIWNNTNRAYRINGVWEPIL